MMEMMKLIFLVIWSLVGVTSLIMVSMYLPLVKQTTKMYKNILNDEEA